MSLTILEELERNKISIPKEVYELALQYGDEGTLDLIEYLIDENIAPKRIACRIWSDRIEYAYVDPVSTIISNEAIASVPIEIARKGNVMPLYEIEGALTVAMPDPTNELLIQRLAAITNKQISPVFCLTREVQDAIELHYSTEKSVKELIEQFERSHGAILSQIKPDELADLSASESVASLCESFLYLAIKERASDIHIEPSEHLTSIRFRIDGRLQSLFKVNPALHPTICSRIKILCNLDIAESRFPQDGRFSISLGAGNVNFRVSVLPTIYGEKVVLRILALTGKKDFQSLDEMFISQNILEPYKRVIRSPNGMIFMTGPTGSGKSTTLYASLQQINSPSINICTIEDPVETRIDGIIQTQVNEHIDLKFSTVLRSLLRQDPDVMLVGEIRDLETARIATEAALTGHLVLSTLHTNSAIQAVVRLIEIGIEPYMVAPSILAVMAQRLAARICENCKRAYTPSPETLDQYFYDAKDIEPPMFYHGRGCGHCRDTGYYGRIAFHEMVLVSDEMRSMISRRAADEDLVRAAQKMGYKPLRYDALKKVLLGFTTIEELEAHASFDWVAP